MSSVHLDKTKAIQLHQEGKGVQLHGIVDSKILKAAVYGANDGIITTFAVVVGVAGAGLPPSIVLILGIANLIADGIAMGIGDYLGERSEQGLKKYQYEVEKWEIANIHHEEKLELAAFFEKRKVKEPELNQLVTIISHYPELWAELGFIEEMGSSPEATNHLWQTGFTTFWSFVLAGALPLLPYALRAVGLPITLQQEFPASVIATGATLFFIGSLRTVLTKGRWWRNGLEMLAIGALAAVAAYIGGAVVKSLIH